MNQKQALGMTRTECIAAGLAEVQNMARAWFPATLNETLVRYNYAELHRQAVKDALREGQAVRWDVLAEYPDLMEPRL